VRERDVGVSGKIILYLIFKKRNGKAWTRLMCFRLEFLNAAVNMQAGVSECGNEHAGWSF
jgi:hypothetical protein